MSKAFDFIREAKEELYKVNWPSRKELTKLSAIVIVVSLVLGFGLGGVDYVLGQGVALLIK
jgi:preprotein translocase SecE subunit